MLLRIMLAGHMDEVGFMVKHISADGYIRFTPLGGWWDQVLLESKSSHKNGYKGDVIGVIGAKPPHLLSPEERNKVVVRKNMYIDIGATSEKDVEKAGVRIGDPIVPVSEFTVLANPKTYMSKAFDDRVGMRSGDLCSKLACQEEPSEHSIWCCNSTGRGRCERELQLVWIWSIPDIAIILESDIAGDVPGNKT